MGIALLYAYRVPCDLSHQKATKSTSKMGPSSATLILKCHFYDVFAKKKTQTHRNSLSKLWLSCSLAYVFHKSKH